jgi:NADH-quinone oxidoreductase subunit L
MLRFIIFAPLVGAALNWFVGRQLLKRGRTNEPLLGGIACAAVAVSCLVALWLAFRPGAGVLVSNHIEFDHLWTWIQVGRFKADFGLGMDRLSGIYACFITFVGLLIHLFAIGYMHGDRSFYRFFAYLNLFMFMMLTLVLADNLLLMFVGWEGVGLCSYLLIGYYIDRKEAGDAAKKAFVANRVGDWGVVLGIMLVFALTGSISFFDTPEGVTGAAAATSALSKIAAMPVDAFNWHLLFAGGITSAALLLFIGATGKSAQIPLYVWLPDAMAGPTPVSALIHAATMVTAGVYMVVRCSAIYTHAPTVMFIIAIIGAATAIFAATIGIAQNDIKKVLAYSTVSQLGYMFLACGVGAFVAAIFHVMTHAFFKALLFLGSGSVIHGMHHEQDMRRMGGLKKYMPITAATMTAGWLAICGIVPFAGFFSKDEILWRTWSTTAAAIPAGASKVLWLVGAATALLTAIYMTRLMVMTFTGAERFRETHAVGHADDAHAAAHDEGPGGMHTTITDEHEEHHAPVEPHESPWVMTVPLVVLAILSFVGGWVGIPYALSGGRVPNYFERTLEPAIAHAPERGGATEAEATGVPGHVAEDAEAPQLLSHPPQRVDGASPLSVGEGAQGEPAHERAPTTEEINTERLFTGLSLLIALVGIGIGILIFKKRPLLAMPRILEEKYYVDEIYDAAIINPIKSGSRAGLWRLFDIGVIDGLVNGLGRAVREVGDGVRRVQFGFVRSYAAIILLGALAVIGYFVFSFGRYLR